MAALTPKEISLKYFTLISEETHQYKFKYDAVISYYTMEEYRLVKLFSHVKSQHEEYKKNSNQSE